MAATRRDILSAVGLAPALALLRRSEVHPPLKPDQVEVHPRSPGGWSRAYRRCDCAECVIRRQMIRDLSMAIDRKILATLP